MEDVYRHRQLDIGDVGLMDFDRCFFETIPGYKKVLFNKVGIYHVIVVGGEKAGVVGYIPIYDDEGKQINFVQIALVDKFRGKGLTKLAEDRLVKEHELKQLYATIDIKNTPSIKAHLRAGFKELGQDMLNAMRVGGFLKNSQTRLVKDYFH